jgi:integration host factor subunit alpha
MTKADLANEVYQKVGISRVEASDIVELLLETLKATLAEGETVKIAGFGTFLVRKKGARKGRNIKTGEVILIAPRKVVTFRPSLQFKSMVDNPPL